jgi:hypothetical protein
MLSPLMICLCLIGPSPSLRAQDRDTSERRTICGEPEQGSLLEQICTLDGSSQKLEGRFDTGFLPGGSTARLVIGRKFKPEEKLEFQGMMIWGLPKYENPPVTTTRLRILSVEAEEQTGKTVLNLDVWRVEGMWPYLDARFMVAAYQPGKAFPTDGAAPLYVVERVATVSSQWFSVVASITLVVALYIASALWFGKGKNRKWSPVVITAGVMGRGSVSKLQIFFFSFVVVWLLNYILLRTGELSALSPHVLMLLGISAAGTAGAKAAAVTRNRLSTENWTWLVKKRWVKAQPDRREAGWADLLVSDGEFDVSKFQMLAFNLVVAVALLMSGLTELANFTIPETLLGVLGLSQVVYLGGKVMPANPYADLDRMTGEVRALESEFVEVVAEKWQQEPPENRTPSGARDLDTAKADALAKYSAYIEAAQKLVVAVKSTLKDTATPTFNTEPDIPN